MLSNESQCDLVIEPEKLLESMHGCNLISSHAMYLKIQYVLVAYFFWLQIYRTAIKMAQAS